MSESAPESGGSLDSAFSRRYGPLTGLQWTGVAAAGGGLYIWYRNRHAASTGSSTTSGQATAYGYTGQPYDYGPSIAAQQSEIQALQSGTSGTGTSTPPTSSTGTSTAETAKVGALYGANGQNLSGNQPAWLFGSPGQAGGGYNTGGPPVATIPIGSTITITGPAVTGAAAGNPSSPSTTYFPVSYGGQSGYVSAANIQQNSIGSTLAQGG